MTGVDGGALHSSGALSAHRVAGADGKLNTADDTFTMATWGDLKAPLIRSRPATAPFRVGARIYRRLWEIRASAGLSCRGPCPVSAA